MKSDNVDNYFVTWMQQNDSKKVHNRNPRIKSLYTLTSNQHDLSDRPTQFLHWEFLWICLLLLGWVGLGWVGLDWIGLDWIGLDWIGCLPFVR